MSDHKRCVFYGGSMDGKVLHITNGCKTFYRPVIVGANRIAKEVYQRTRGRKFEFVRVASPQEPIGGPLQ